MEKCDLLTDLVNLEANDKKFIDLGFQVTDAIMEVDETDFTDETKIKILIEKVTFLIDAVENEIKAGGAEFNASHYCGKQVRAGIKDIGY